MRTRDAYERAFEDERARVYPAVDRFELEYGYSLFRPRMEEAARVLACPVKANHPCWQHGRIVYAVVRDMLSRAPHHDGVLLDIGTAKGFSALCMAWAARDAKKEARIVSVDVLDPEAKLCRNSIADLDGPKTLREYLAPWPDAARIEFLRSTGVDWLKANPWTVAFAFVDGKHSYEAVSEEARLLRERQEPGGLILFDDLQMRPVRKAVERIEGYDVRVIHAAEDRTYALAVKRC